MSGRASMRLRPRRKVKVKLPLTEQDLREYLDDGYTPARIAKEYGVSLTVISEKMQKLRVKGRSKPRKVVKKRKAAVPPKKQKTRGRPASGRSSSRRRQKDRKDPQETPKQDLNSVITQVIQDNPKEVDNIHALLDFMGFNVEKSFVEDHLQKWKTLSGTSPRKGENLSKLDDVTEEAGQSSQEMEHGTSEEEDDARQTTPSEDGGSATASQLTEDGSAKIQTAEETSVTDEEKVVDAAQGDDVTLDMKDENISKDEPLEPEPVKKRRRGRPRKTCRIKPLEEDGGQRPKRRRTRKVDKKDEDGNAGDSDANGVTEDKGSESGWSEDTENKKHRRKRGRKRKAAANEEELAQGKGRPRLNLSKENLQLCIDSGLTTAKIAEVFGAGVQSVKRYLRIHKMRKKDRISKISDEELDKMVLEMCKAHPEWGQVHIQEELKRKGFFLCRAQVRNSVRRVDPVGIEVRRLKNLKMRWNRGSMNKLDKILPADGINMTSTESFVSKPPRNGLNALSDEESIRILASVVASSNKTYVEPTRMSLEKLVHGKKSSEDKDESLESKEKQCDDEEDGRKETLGDLEMAIQEIEDADKTTKEETGNEENIKTESSKEPDRVTSSAEMLEGDDEEKYRKRFYNMVMSNEKYRKESSPEMNESSVDIPKEELQECVNLGFSTARMAERFCTSRSNVIRHLTMHKLGKPRRFENITDEALDEIVKDLVKEFSIRKGSDVYGFAKKKGFQIRRVDIHKSLARLYPKGLHRKSSSILQESWESASRPDASDLILAIQRVQGKEAETGNSGDTSAVKRAAGRNQGQTGEVGSDGGPLVMEYTTRQGQVQGVQTANGGETVVVLNSEDLAELIHGEGNIVIEYESGEQVTEHGVIEQMVSQVDGQPVGQVNLAQQQSQVYLVAEATQEIVQNE